MQGDRLAAVNNRGLEFLSIILDVEKVSADALSWQGSIACKALHCRSR